MLKIQTIIQKIRARFWHLPQHLQARARQQRNQYMRVYMREVYPKQRRRISLTLTPAQYDKLQKQAQRSGRPLAVFVREAALAYLERRYLVPKHLERSLWQLTRQLRAAGNHLNQIAHQVNIRKHASLSELKQARALLKQMEARITQSVTCPQAIENQDTETQAEENQKTKTQELHDH